MTYIFSDERKFCNRYHHCISLTMLSMRISQTKTLNRELALIVALAWRSLMKEIFRAHYCETEEAQKADLEMALERTWIWTHSRVRADIEKKTPSEGTRETRPTNKAHQNTSNNRKGRFKLTQTTTQDGKRHVHPSLEERVKPYKRNTQAQQTE